MTNKRYLLISLSAAATGIFLYTNFSSRRKIRDSNIVAKSNDNRIFDAMPEYDSMANKSLGERYNNAIMLHGIGHISPNLWSCEYTNILICRHVY